MDFLRLLEIDRSLIPPEAQRSLLIAEMVWTAAGSPQDRAGLCAALEKTLQSCTRQGIWYAPVLLQRKKALERGTWRPLGREKKPEPARGAAQGSAPGRGPAPGAAEHGSACAQCGGSGIAIAADGRSGTFCSCGAYLARFGKALAPAAKTT